MANPFRLTVPPAHVTGAEDVKRWHGIDRQRKRAAHWFGASVAMRLTRWGLAIITVIVAGISAGRPGAPWCEATVRDWATAVAILAGLSGLIPWEKGGRAYQRAHNALADVITLYDNDHAGSTYTVEYVVDAAQKIESELFADERRSARPH